MTEFSGAKSNKNKEDLQAAAFANPSGVEAAAWLEMFPDHCQICHARGLDDRDQSLCCTQESKRLGREFATEQAAKEAGSDG